MDMDHGHMHDMGPPPSSAMVNNGTGTGGMGHKKMMMHMSFYWGNEATVLFTHWPGTRGSGMYFLSLVVVFVLSVLVEWLSHCRLIKPGSGHVSAGLIQTLLHALRMGLAYMVMLAVMSFNGGVFLVAVAGHALGFLLFGSRVFNKGDRDGKNSHLPPMSC
ncbi:copper transporter 1 [Carica papaya]|uniref:copper transporter 1 n=1 Tax=Carica papaya TaxID=3649 RepID=UPI000B8C8FB4|nr:copper transporter 1 [Carica papaya]